MYKSKLFSTGFGQLSDIDIIFLILCFSLLNCFIYFDEYKAYTRNNNGL